MTTWTLDASAMPVADASDASPVGPVPKRRSPLDLEVGDVIAGADGHGWEVLSLDREPWPYGKAPSTTTHVTARPVDYAGGYITRRTVTWRGWGANCQVTVLNRPDSWVVADDPAALVPAPPF